MRKYRAAGGAGCLGQDFSIKCVVKNGWLRHLAASPSRQQWQFSRSTLTLFLLSRVFFFFFCACTDRLRAAAPPFVLCKFTHGLLDMLDAMGKKRNKRGGEKEISLTKWAALFWKQRWTKGEPNSKKNEDFIQFCAPMTLKLLFLYAGKSSAMVNNHTVICVCTKTVVIPFAIGDKTASIQATFN